MKENSQHKATLTPAETSLQERNQSLVRLSMALTGASRLYTSACDRIAENFGLTQAVAWPAVMISRMGDGVRPGEVAEALSLGPSSVVRLIDLLIQAGLVERHEDQNDRRARALSLTPDGKQRIAQLEAALLPFRAALFAGISQSDLETCVRVLETLRNTIRKNGNPAAV